jgi:hypothetical protein
MVDAVCTSAACVDTAGLEQSSKPSNPPFTAAGSHDKHVLLWNTYGECENFMVLKGAERLYPGHNAEVVSWQQHAM